MSIDGRIFVGVCLRRGGGDKPALSTLSGDVGVDIPPGRNKHIVWDAGSDWTNHVQSNFVATVTAAVAWVRNTAGAYIGTAARSSDFAVSFYRNGSWSPASVAAPAQRRRPSA